MSGIGFAQPALAAAAAAAVALPILIHLLLRRRRSPVEWAAMDLLREALRRVERKRRVERWLLLAVRCLLVLAAGMAIAAPFVGGAAALGRAARSVVVVVDDSAASSERLERGTALERAVQSAGTVIDGLQPGDRVAVLRASEARGVVRTEPATLDLRTARQALAAIGSTERVADLPAALEAADAILAMDESRGTRREVWVASAFRAGSVGALPPLPALGSADRPVELHATLPPPATGANLRLASLEPVRVPGSLAGEAPMLRAVVERDRGDGPLRATLSVSGPSVTTAAERTVELAAGERTRTVDVAIAERTNQPGDALRRAAVATLSADAQPTDDGRAVPLAPVERVRVVIVDRRSFDAQGAIDRLSPGEWVARALAPGTASSIDVATVDPAALDARAVAAADTVVVVQPSLLARGQWDILAGVVQRGATVVVTPVAAERPQAWTNVLRDAFGVPWACALEAKDLAQPVALAAEQPPSGVLGTLTSDIPRMAPSVDVVRVLPIDPAGDANAVQVVLADGTPVVLSWRPKDARGSVVMLAVAVDLAWTTLPLKPLMVPLWQEIVAEGRRQATALRTVTVGSMPAIDRPGVVELRLLGADGVPVSGARPVQVASGGRTVTPIERAGLYELRDADGRVQGVLAAVIDPAAASVAPVEQERLAGWLGARCMWTEDGSAGGGAAAVTQAARDLGGAPIAAWLFAAAIMLAIAEAALANRFSHATSTAAPTRRHDPARVAAGGAA
jgi:hypothetical protein